LLAFLHFNGTIYGTFGVVALIAAVVFVAPSLISFCPLYPILGKIYVQQKNNITFKN